MQERLKALAELQKIDLEVAALRKSSEVYPKAMGELERELSAAKSEVEAERAKLLDVERQRRTLEQNISEEKDKARKWEARLAEQRSTREYAALAREIDIAKKANLTMAEELVELGKLQAQVREVAKSKEQQYAGRMGETSTKLTELRAKMAGFEGQAEGAGGQARRGRPGPSTLPCSPATRPFASAAPPLWSRWWQARVRAAT